MQSPRAGIRAALIAGRAVSDSLWRAPRGGVCRGVAARLAPESQNSYYASIEQIIETVREHSLRWLVLVVDVHGSRCRRAVAEHAAHLVQRDCFRRELRHPPGGARRGVGHRVCAGWEADGDVVGAVVCRRSSVTVATISASWSGCSRLTGMKPSCPAARRSGLTFPRSPAAHTGTPGR